MVFCLLLSYMPVTSAAAGGTDATNLLTNLAASVSQNGAQITDGTKLDSTKPLDVHFSFGVPVKGDGGTGGTVQQGDTAQIELAKGFLYSGETVFNLISGGVNGVKVGTLTLNTTGTGIDAALTANVVFDGAAEVFDGTTTEAGVWSNVVCDFDCQLTYAGTGTDAAEGDHNVIILSKSYTVTVPTVPVTVGAEKTGVKNGQNIDWVVKVQAKKGEADADLSTYAFTDALAEVGAYVGGSFRVGANADGTGAAAVADDTVYTADTQTLHYAFAAGDAGTRYIFFSTKIPESKLSANGKQTVANAAHILQGGTEVASPAGSVEFTSEVIKKAVSQNNNDGTLSWTITANTAGATLTNAVITDQLDSRMKWTSAKVQYYDGSKWGTENAITPGANGAYSLGTISAPVLLTITATLDTAASDIKLGHQTVHIDNKATISWDSQPGIASETVGADIGLNPIRKTAGDYDRAQHTIPWTVTVVKSDISENLRVLDLMFYAGSGFDKNATYTLAAKESSPQNSEGTGLHSVDAALLSGLTPQYNQSYVAGSLSGAEYTVYTVYSGTTAVADLLVATGAGGGGIDPSAADQTFTYKSEVTNPAHYMGGAAFKISNTAELFSANASVNSATATKECFSSAMEKDMLTRTEAAKLTGTATDAQKLAAADSTAATADTAFDYTDKSVVFRIHVNANGVVIPAAGLTTAGGKTLSGLSVTDVLPAGWEFEAFADGSQYILLSGSASTSNNKKVTATAVLASPKTLGAAEGTAVTASKTAATAAAGETLTFAFGRMDGAYVILVRAKPTTAKATAYFSKNGTTAARNTATLKNAGETELCGDWEEVNVKSTLLNKTKEETKDKALKWSVEYKPCDLPRTADTITDTLPVGLDVRILADGSLDFSNGNITITKLTLKADGTYTDGESVAVNSGNVSYDTVSRALTFHLADTAQAYRFTYITDVTADGGVTLKNSVSFVTGTTSSVSTAVVYSAQAAFAQATMQRSGYIVIQKTDDAGAAVAGAVFTVYAQKADGTIDEATVIRTGTTAADGSLTLRGLPVGRYFLKETQAPNGYVLSTAVHLIEISKDIAGKIILTVDGTVNAAKTLTAVNHPAGTVIVRKLAGDTAAAQPGAVLELWKQGGTAPLETWTTDGTDHTVGSLLADGTYVLKETAAPDGYTRAQDLTFTLQNGIVADASVRGNTLILINQPTRASVSKTDAATGKALAGAKLQIRDETGSIVAEWTSDGSAYAVVGLLKAGAAYTLHEVSAPAGYRLAADIAFTANSENATLALTMQDAPILSGTTETGGGAASAAAASQAAAQGVGSPRTGDAAPVLLWSSLLLFGVAGLLLLYPRMRKKQK